MTMFHDFHPSAFRAAVFPLNIEALNPRHTNTEEGKDSKRIFGRKKLVCQIWYTKAKIVIAVWSKL